MEKAKGGVKKPTKSFRSFLVRDMREEQYKEFVAFCDEQGLDFAPAITMLKKFWDFNWSASKTSHFTALQLGFKQLAENEKKEEEKPKERTITRLGGD